MIAAFDRQFEKLPALLRTSGPPPSWDNSKPTAIVLVGSFGGLGLHMLFAVLRMFPETFHNVVFASVGAVDSEFFKEGDRIKALTASTQEMLEKYVAIAAKAGKPARSVFRVGTDVVEAASDLCLETFLHNETAFAIQRRLKFGGVPMVILPVVLRVPTVAIHASAPTS